MSGGTLTVACRFCDGSGTAILPPEMREAWEALSPAEPVSTNALAERLGIGYQLMRYRLDILARHGLARAVLQPVRRGRAHMWTRIERTAGTGLLPAHGAEP